MATTKTQHTPKVSDTIQILKPLDRTKPIEVHMAGIWTHVEVLSLERSILKTLKHHLVTQRKSNQASKGQD